MANQSDAQGEILLGQVWPRRTIVALAYVLTITSDGRGYGIWNSTDTLQNADALPRNGYGFNGCGKWTISNTLKDMLCEFSDWVRKPIYGIGREITDEEMLVMYQILVKDMLEEALDFTVTYVDYEPGTSRLVSGMMGFKSSGTRLFLDSYEEEELPYTMRTMINEFGWDEDKVLDVIDAATCDMDLDGIDKENFFNDLLEKIMDKEADNLQPDPYWDKDNTPKFVLKLLNKHVEKI